MDLPTQHFAASVYRKYVNSILADDVAGRAYRGMTGPADYRALATAAGLDPVQVLMAAGLAEREHYVQHAIPKRGGGMRELLEPPDVLKATQRAIYVLLGRDSESARAGVHDAAHGFVPGRSHATHARLHVGRKVVASIDIQDFFGSVSATHVWMALNRSPLAMPPGAMRALVHLATIESLVFAEEYERTWVTRAVALLDGYVHALCLMVVCKPDSFQLSMTDWRRHDLDRGLCLLAARLVDAGFRGTSLEQRNLAWAAAGRLSTLIEILSGGPAPTSKRRLLDLGCGILGVPQDVMGRSDGDLRRLQEWLSADMAILGVGSAALHRQRLRWQASPRGWSRSNDAVNVGRRVRLLAPACEPRLRARLDLDLVPAAMIPAPMRVVPQGAPTSPWLANLVCFDLDSHFTAYANAHGLTYSRYADDLTFSGDQLPKGFVREVAGALERFGFRLNRNKIAIHGRGRAQMVTGIVVNERPRPGQIGRRALRAMRHRLAQGEPAHLVVDGKQVPLSPASLRGHLAYWHMVDPTRVPWPPDEEG